MCLPIVKSTTWTKTGASLILRAGANKQLKPEMKIFEKMSPEGVQTSSDPSKKFNQKMRSAVGCHTS
jgi:hypothetical protein